VRELECIRNQREETTTSAGARERERERERDITTSGEAKRGGERSSKENEVTKTGLAL